MTYDVFISYESTTGTGFSEHLKNALERRKGHNHKVFLANETLYVGDKWKVEIDSALNSCKYFVVIITSLTMDSDWVMREYQRAKEMNKRIIPCRYSKISVSDTKELANIQQIDFSDKFDLANNVILELRKIDEREREGIGVKKDAEEFLKRGNLLYSLGKFEEAEKEYLEALRINPDLADTYHNLNALYYNLNTIRKSTEAIQNLEIIHKKPRQLSKIFKIYNDEEEILKELIELYDMVKDIHIFTEEFEVKTNLQADSEFRNALDHLMRVLREKLNPKSEKGEEYIRSNLSNARGHIYRVGYDTLDILTISLRKKIIDELSDFSPGTINITIPEYYKKMKPLIEGMTAEILKLRTRKNYGYDLSIFKDYINISNELYNVYRVILSRKSSLIEYEKKKQGGGFLKKILK